MVATYPQYHNQNETQHHFVTRTVSQASDTWVESTSTFKTKSVAMQIDPNLIDIYALLNNQKPTFQPATSHLGRSYRTLIDQQSKIGWHRILKGRVSTQWVVLQNQFQSNSNQGHLAISKLIYLIFIQILNAWKIQCNIQHGLTQLDRNNKIKHQIQPKVEALYKLLPQLDPIDQQFFSQSTSEILQKSLRALEN